jgi:hypothetical protein
LILFKAQCSSALRFEDGWPAQTLIGWMLYPQIGARGVSILVIPRVVDTFLKLDFIKLIINIFYFWIEALGLNIKT